MSLSRNTKHLGEYREAVAALLADALANGESWEVQTWAAEGLSDIGPLGEKSLPALEAAIFPPKDVEARDAAATAIGRMGSVAVGALPALVRAAQGDGPTDGALASAFAGIGEAAVPTLIELLSDAEPRARWVAAEALDSLNEKAAPAVPALRKALNDPENRRLRISERIGEALVSAAAGAAKLEADFVEQLKGGSMESRMAAMGALQKLAPAEGEDAGKLRRKLRSGKVEERLAAAARLGGLKLSGRELTKTIEELNEALSDPSDDVRFVALAARLAIEFQRGPETGEEARPSGGTKVVEEKFDPVVVAKTRAALERKDTSEAFRQLALLVAELEKFVPGATP